MKKPARRKAPSFAGASQRPAAERSYGLLRLQLCFFLSGAAGLVDQVVWTKLLAQLFGNTAQAIAIVVAVFMGGLALGSAWYARWSRAKSRRAGVVLYAWLECAIAAAVLFSFAGIAIVRQFYFAAYPHIAWPGALAALRILAAAIVLLLPTVLMGATFPALVAAVAQVPSQLGARAARFYAVNTLGAVAGTLLAGFWWIPAFGLRASLILAALLNLSAAILAQQVARRPQFADEPSDAPDASAVREISPRAALSPPTRLYLFCFAAVGATAIAYELAWTRLLATPLGSSTYAFSLMLAAFLLGLAAGSALFAVWIRRRPATAGLFGATQIAIAGAALLSLLLYNRIPDIFLALLRGFGSDFHALLFAQALACALALLPLTILFGFNFPSVLALLRAEAAGTPENLATGGAAGSIGRAFAANTLGGIFAALCVGFLLLRAIGSFRLVACAALLNLGLGVWLLFSARQLRWKSAASVAVLLAGLIWAVSSAQAFRKGAAAFAVVLYGGYHSEALSAQEMADTEDVVFFKDGANASIAVTRAEDYVALKTNGKVDASNLDSGTQLLLGDLGAVFHPHPRNVLIIGFGGGMTASAVARFPEVERIDCVEIEPAVLQAAPQLARLNRGVLSDPRLRLHFDDARNFLQTTPAKYDLIISEPSNPWIAGIASLYTREFFAIARAHLADGGALVQWVQAYGLTFEDLATIASALRESFPDTSLWRSTGRDFLFLAQASHKQPENFDRSRALWNNAALRADFATLHLHQPEGWPAFFRLGPDGVAQLAAHAQPNTDDRTLLEYTAPRHIRDESLTTQLAASLASLETSPLPPGLEPRERDAAALAAAEASIEFDPPRTARYLALVPDRSAEVEVSVLRARIAIAEKRYAEAIQELSTPDLANQNSAVYWLSAAQRESGALSQAQATLAPLLLAQPDDERILQLQSGIAADRKDWPAAIAAQTRLTTQQPESSAAACRLGDLFMRSANFSAAEPPLAKGIELDRYSFLCHRDLGELYRATGRLADAARELRWVVRYFPEGDPKTYVSLALA
ncbi:MAG TPA: fused MFS/spermidine synthase, partial [Dongiaceae bacterium]|nr:fused MFS/spermidine synthase [Dongiaceae bacterium]